MKRPTSAKTLPRYEVHGHCFITGPNSHYGGLARGRVVHSHDGGDRPHVHEDATHRTGPGAYTIDKDEWLRRTGLVGGGRKKYTVKPSGLQLPVVPVDPPQIRVFIHDDAGASVARGASGPGVAPIVRMQLAVKAEVASVTHIPSGGAA